MPNHNPGPIEKEVREASSGRDGSCIAALHLLARRVDTLSALVDCASDFDVEAARREEEDVDNRLAAVERAVKRLTKET